MTEKTLQERIAEAEKSFSYPVQITKDPATGEYVTRCIGQQTATPGKWALTPHGNIMDDTGVIALVEGGHGRLICAAVNACRDAGYTVKELEAGALKIDRGVLAEKIHVIGQRQATVNLLREALQTCEKYITLSINSRGADNVPVGLYVVALKQARALLARLDAQK